MPANPEVSPSEFRDALLRCRDRAPRPLQFEPDIARLLDHEACERVCRDLGENGARWERRKAVASLGRQLPDERGLYMFVWVPGIRFELAAEDMRRHDLAWVLYVGKAGVEDGRVDTIRSRYTGEYSKFVARSPERLWEPARATPTRSDRLARYLTLRPLEYWYIELSAVDRILELESTLLATLRPPLNTQTGPRARLGTAAPAF